MPLEQDADNSGFRNPDENGRFVVRPRLYFLSISKNSECSDILEIHKIWDSCTTPVLRHESPILESDNPAPTFSANIRVLLALEILIDGRLGYACFLGYLRDGSPAIPFFAEYF